MRPRVGDVATSAPSSAGSPARASGQLDVMRISLFVLMLLDVSRLHQHWPILAKLRLMQAMAACVLFYALLNPKLLGKFGVWSRTWPARVVSGLGVMACLSVVFGISLGGSARFFMEEYVRVLVMTFLIMSAIRSFRDLTTLVWAYVAACGVLIWMALFVFKLTYSVNAGGAYLQGLYMYDGNDVCVVLLAGLGLCLFAFQASGTLGKVTCATIMLGIGDVIARTGSRGGFLGLLAFTAAFLFLPARLSVAKRVAIVGGVALAMQFGSTEGYWNRMRTVLHPKEDYNWSSPTGRRMAAKRGMEYMRKYPLFGVGIMNFPRAEGTVSERAKNWRPDMPGIRWMVPHNSYIQAGSEMGYLGGVLWGSIVVGGIVSCWRLRRRLRRKWARGDREQRLLYGLTQTLPLSFAGFGVSAFFVSFAYLSPVYILAAFVTGLHVVVQERLRRDSNTLGPASVQAVSAHRAAPTYAPVARAVP